METGTSLSGGWGKRRKASPSSTRRGAGSFLSSRSGQAGPKTLKCQTALASEVWNVSRRVYLHPRATCPPDFSAQASTQYYFLVAWVVSTKPWPPETHSETPKTLPPNNRSYHHKVCDSSTTSTSGVTSYGVFVPIWC